MTTTVVIALTAALVGLVIGALAVWLWVRRRLNRLAGKVAAIHAQAIELVAALTAMPPGPHRANCAEYRAKQIKAITDSAMHHGREAGGLARVRDPHQPNRTTTPRRARRARRAAVSPGRAPAN